MRRSAALLALIAAVALASERRIATVTSSDGSSVSKWVGRGWSGYFNCPGALVHYVAGDVAPTAVATDTAVDFTSGGDSYPVTLASPEGYLAFRSTAAFTCYLYTETTAVLHHGRAPGVAASSSGSNAVTVDSGTIDARVSNFPSMWPSAQVVLVDSGTVDARVTSLPAVVVDGGINISSLPAVVIDGGVNVSNFPTAYTVSVDGGGAAGTLGVGQVGTWSSRVVGNAGGAFDSANNASPPANVVAVGVDTIASGSQPSAATSTNVRRPTAGIDGVLFTKPFGPAFFNVGVESGSTSNVAIKAAPGAGLRVYVTDITIISSTMTGSGSFRLVTGTGGTCGVGTSTLLPTGAAGNRFWYPPAGDGGVTTFGQPLQMQFLTPIVAPANQDVCLVCVATNTCNANVNGYIAP